MNSHAPYTYFLITHTYVCIPTLTPLESFSCFAADCSSGVQEGEAGDVEEAEELEVDGEAKGQSREGEQSLTVTVPLQVHGSA